MIFCTSWHHEGTALQLFQFYPDTRLASSELAFEQKRSAAVEWNSPSVPLGVSLQRLMTVTTPARC